MPSTRRVKIRGNWRKRGRPSPSLESEPQDLRTTPRRLVMDQNPETNGCDNSPVTLANSNHSEVVQCSPKTDKQMAKSLGTPETKKPRHSSGSVKPKGNRPRRSVPSPASNSTSPISPTAERRATRNLPPSPTKTTPRTLTAAERKLTKNYPPIPATNAQSNKKVSQPPVLSPQLAGSMAGQQVLQIETTPVATTSIPRVAKPQQSPRNSSPPLLKSQKRQLKRQVEIPSMIDLDQASLRASKRVRLQHQPFQSPPPPTIIPAILRQQIIKTPEDKICVFQKGEFLAVRNENGSFFVCRTAQNVYKSSKRFKIQWMSDKDKDIYIPDFYDQTDFECVLTNLRLRRVDKNKYMLPSDERQRTLNILQRALNVENGMDISPLQVTTDGVDVSIVGKEDEEILRIQQQNLKNEQKNRVTNLRNRGRPPRPEPVAKVTRSSTLAEKKVNKTLAARVKLRARETVKVKLKKEGGRIIVSNKSGKPVAKLRKIAERLHPNPKVTVFEKDPTFEMNIPIPYVSSSAHSKLLIRAICLKDINMLQTMIKDTQQICSLNALRSVDVPLAPLMYAVLEEDHRAIRLLLTVNKRKYANPPETLLEYQQTGRYNVTSLGHSVKPLNACRGGREGNNAFLKDLNFYNETYPEVNSNVVKEALRAGVSFDTLNLLFAEGQNDNYCWEKNEVLKQIIVAIRNGHHKLAGQLVDDGLTRGGYGFNVLHKEVLLSDRQPLSTFKSVSVTKMAVGNSRITPLHCSAINPNPQYLTALLSVSPEYNLADENGWRLIHYASVCKSTGPLELLVSRGISLEEVESDGNTALHIASLAGRAHNVDLILRHLISTEHTKKETSITVSLQDKQCVNAIDRGNKKSFTALHIACRDGHADVVRVLLRHKANMDKLTNAQQDKLTPLMLASQKGHLDIVGLLIEHSAQVEMKDKKQRTALTHAVTNGHAHVTSYLLRLGANPNSTDSSGNTLVHYAAAYGWYFCLKLLIEAGASLNLPNDWKITPLSLAFMKGHMGIVDFLVEQPGIDINVDVNNESGMTLVMQALRSRINHSMLERIHFLVVKQKSDCTKLDYMGCNAFHHLVLAEVEEMKHEIKMEIDDEKSEVDSSEDRDAAPSTKVKHKEKQLFKEEAQQEHDALIQEITKLLLDHGCDPMIKNKEGESPFNLAVKEGCLLLVKMFLDAGCQLSLDVSQTGDNILHYLVTHARHRKVEPMLQAILNAKCSDPETTPHQLLCQMAKMYNKNGHTPLLQALNALKTCHYEEGQNRLLSFTKFLLDEVGADVSSPSKDKDDKETCFALHLATRCNGSRVLEVLLAHKPPLNSFDSDGQTPLIIAIKQENIEAVEALVKAGAIVNLKSKDKENLSPLLLASKKPNLGKVVLLLVQNKADVNETDKKNKNTALHYVVSIRASNVLETAKALLTSGANVDAVNDSQRTPLHLSVNSSSSDSDASYAVEECLLGFGAKADALDCRSRMPLHYAFTKIGRHTDSSQIDPMELVVLLVDAMPEKVIEHCDQFGRTLLHSAAFRGATISTMHIAKHMKNLDGKDKDGNTALGLAVRNGHESCALMLLQRGASCVADLVATKSEAANYEENKNWIWKHSEKKPRAVEKHTVLQETLMKDWQGILYLMLDQLDAMGKGINIAVEAALRTAKYNVALKLIGKVKHSWTLYNEKQSMLHVLAREAPADYFPELQVKVAQFLIEKGVPVMTRDEHGCSVLTYAAMNWNHTLCSFFTVKMGIVAASQIEADKSRRTPLAAALWRLAKEDLSEDMKTWCSSLLKAGTNPNILAHFPIVISPFPGVRCTIVNTLHVEDPDATKLSPLIMAIYRNNFSVVKLFLTKGADVNYPDDQLRTPLMHAVRLNDIKMVKLLLNSNYDPTKEKSPLSGDTDAPPFQKTCPVNLAAQDANGWTVIHHIVSPLPDYCYASTALLNLLAEVGTPLEITNTEGETPLQMATKLQREPLVTALQKLLKTPEDQKVKLELSIPAAITDDIQWDQPITDYKEDSKNLISKVEGDMQVEKQDELQPDPLSGFDTIGEVLLDTEKSIGYDVVMTVVDLNYGAYGIYNFYKMQIIKHKGKELFILFTCWGRVGDTGQFQKTPFTSSADAVKEFCRIFRSKSGNTWDDVKNFQPQPKKYRLVELEKRKHVALTPIKIDLKSDLPSKLSLPLQKLMSGLMNVHTIESTLIDLGVNATFGTLPFGNLSESTLLTAENLLKQIGDVIMEKDNLRQNAKSQEKFAELMHKIVKLSEEFYQLIPVYGYQYEKLSPLFSAPDVHSKLVLIHNLLHIGLSSEVLLGASARVSDVNPKDYVYRSLGCCLKLLGKECQEAQMILQYIHNTALSNKPKVQSIYSVCIPGQSESFKNLALSQRMLLWHGTRLSNMLSIMSRGLQVAPLGAQMNGNLFGKGIYFADMFAKSRKYCLHHHSSELKCILLCEVALGDMKEVDYTLVVDPAEKYDSIKALGHTQPDPAESVLWQGMTVPLGTPINTLDQGNSHHYLNFNEYVVYNASQLCIRYLIQFND